MTKPTTVEIAQQLYEGCLAGREAIKLLALRDVVRDPDERHRMTVQAIKQEVILERAIDLVEQE